MGKERLRSTSFTKGEGEGGGGERVYRPLYWERRVSRVAATFAANSVRDGDRQVGRQAVLRLRREAKGKPPKDELGEQRRRVFLSRVGEAARGAPRRAGQRRLEIRVARIFGATVARPETNF